MAEEKRDEIENQARYTLPQSPILEVKLRIGGKSNTSTSIPIVLKPLNVPYELKRLFKLIEEIESVHIFVHDFQLDIYHYESLKQKLDLFLKGIQALMRLQCLAHQKKEIHDASCWFLEYTLENIQINPIQIGMPSYETYLNQLHTLNVAIQTVRNALKKVSFDIQNSPLSIVNPRSKVYSFGNLPKSLLEFEQSIEINDVCFARWFAYLQQYENDNGTLTHYALQKIDEIRDLSRQQPEYAAHIIYKIKCFVNFLRANNVIFFGLNIIADIASGANSPQRPNRTYVIQKSETPYETAMKTLKGKIDKLLRTKDFNQDFKAFQQSVSFVLAKFPHHKEDVLGELRVRIQQRDPSLKRTKIVEKYIERAITRLTSPLPQRLADEYVTLRTHYERPQATARQQRKLSFLNDFTNKARSFPEKSYRQCYAEAYSETDDKTKKMLSESIYTVFAKHRFKRFVRELVAEDLIDENAVSRPH